MRGFMSVAVRELVDRRAVLFAALAAAIIPVVLPLLPGLAGHSVAEVRGTTAWVTALCLAWVLAAGFGSSMVASDLFEGRLGFYFSRPLRPTAIWAGKLLANFLLVVGAELLVLLPTALMASSRPSFEFGGWEMLAVAGVVFGIPLLLLLVTHAFAVMLRARSAWVAIDAVLLLTVAFAVWAAMSPLYLSAPKAFSTGLVFLVVGLLAALVAAGAVQAAIGRTDVQKSHKVLSVVLWSALGVVAVLAAGFSWWIFSAGPDDLVSIDGVEAAPEGPWVVVEGTTHSRFDYRPRFLFNTESGASLRLVSPGWYNAFPVAFSGDGARAAWIHPEGNDQWQLVTASLGNGTPETDSSGLFFGAPVGLDLNESGGRIAVFETRVVSVYDTRTWELLIAAPIEDGQWIRFALWLTDDVIRLQSDTRRDGFSEEPRVITEIDVATGTIQQTGTMQPEAGAAARQFVTSRHDVYRFDVERDRLLEIHSRGEGGWTWFLREARSGALVVDLGPQEDAWSVGFLADGRLVRCRVDSDGAWLETLLRTGEPENRIFLGEGSRVVLGGEVAPGVVSLSVTRDDSGNWKTSRWEAAAVDVNEGSVRTIPDAAWPAGLFNLYETGLLSNGRLFLDADEQLVEWDPATGETRRVL